MTLIQVSLMSFIIYIKITIIVIFVISPIIIIISSDILQLFIAQFFTMTKAIANPKPVSKSNGLIMSIDLKHLFLSFIFNSG